MVVRTEFEKIIGDLQNKNYAQVIDRIIQARKKGASDPRIEIIYAYSLIQMKRFIEASNVKLPKIFDSNYTYIVKCVFIGLNQTKMLKTLKFSDPMELYEVALLNYEYESCVMLSKEIKRNRNHFTVFSIVAQAIYEKKTHHMKLLKKIIQTGSYSTNCMYFLKKHNILEDEVYAFVKETDKRDLCYFLTLKEFFMDDRSISFAIGKDRASDKETVNFLLDNLDDWDIYEYAIRKNIELPERSTLNYLYYRFYYEKSECAQKKLIQNISGVSELEKINEIHPIATLKDYFERNIEQRLAIFHEDPSLINLKLLLSLLIGSREENLIVLAFYLTYKYKNNDEYGYEIQLIHLFICRYLLYLPGISMEMHSLRIQEIQKINLSFLYHDASVFYRKRFDDIEEMVMNNLKIINESMITFVNTGKFDVAISLLNLKKRFEDNMIVKEIKANKILFNEVKNMFSDLLGSNCAYFFNKYAKQKMRPGILKNLYNLKNTGDDYKKLLINDYYNLRDESEFSDALAKIVEYQEGAEDI